MTSRTRRRVGTILLAALAALTAWAGFRLAGVELHVSTGGGTVGPGDVVAAALVGGLGGWLVVRLLERHTSRPELWWPALGSSGLALSLVGPSHLAHGTSAAALIALHFVTGIVVISGFATTLKCVDCHAPRRSVAL